MKITAIETIRFEQRPNLVWVELQTDQGLTGLGESWFGASAIETDIHDRIAPLLLGADPRRIESLNRSLRPYAGYCGSGAELRAVSAIDVALWDLCGKLAGLPIYQLLGGACRDTVPVYNTCAGPDYVSQSSDVRPGNFGLASDNPQYEDLHAFMNSADELAASLLDMGIDSMKIWPFDFAAGAADGLALTTAEINTALEPFEKIRKAHGDRMRIKAELHGMWALPAAISICKALEPLDPDWVEDPIWMDRPADLGTLASTTRAPLAGGETAGGLGQVRDLIESKGLAVPIVDVTWGGGITFAKKAATLAEANTLPVAFHDCSGPITLTASTHLAMNCTNVREQEITRGFYYGWYADMVTEPPPLQQGSITAPAGPGLGLELLPDIRKRDGAVVRISK